MKEYILDIHIIILVIIMIIVGSFGGYLNYLNNFDTNNNENEKVKNSKNKYILLGIGAAFLVPLFLKMIASNLISFSKGYDNCNYLIFSGFCLIASIFSRRFITTIGDKILETAKRAERIANESNKKSESTQKELTSAQERIEDVKLSADIQSREESIAIIDDPEKELLEIVDSYIARTSIENYSERLKLKAEFGRKMGEMIIRNNLSKEKLLNDYPKEGMFLALAYAVQLKPDNQALKILNNLASSASQLYTKYAILIGYKTLARNGFVTKENVRSIYDLITKFKENADNALLRNINETINVLKFIEPEL